MSSTGDRSWRLGGGGAPRPRRRSRTSSTVVRPVGVGGRIVRCAAEDGRENRTFGGLAVAVARAHPPRGRRDAAVVVGRRRRVVVDGGARAAAALEVPEPGGRGPAGGLEVGDEVALEERLEVIAVSFRGFRRAPLQSGGRGGAILRGRREARRGHPPRLALGAGKDAPPRDVAFGARDPHELRRKGEARPFEEDADERRVEIRLRPQDRLALVHDADDSLHGGSLILLDPFTHT